MRYFIVGPSQLHPKVPDFMNWAIETDILSISHRSRNFESIFQNTTDSLRELMDIPESHHIFFMSSATEAMERVIQNLVDKSSFHFVNGSFSKRFYQTAVELGKNAIKEEVPMGQGFSDVQVPKTELICFTQCETSTGVEIPMNYIYRVREQNPDALIAIDMVSSIPCVDVDFSRIDCAFFSVQKGFGLPAGLGVLIVNEKCIEKNSKLKHTGTYHSFKSLLKKEAKHQTPETPNVLGIYLLGRICDEMINYGATKLRKETYEKAKMIYDFFDMHEYKPFVKDKGFRSSTVAVIEVPDSAAVIDRLAKNGYLLSSGYGPNKHKQIRIGNYPSHVRSEIETLLSLF